MSDRPPPTSSQTGLGLSDRIFDPEILTKEIDHDFFDDPPETTESIDFKECQEKQAQVVSAGLPKEGVEMGGSLRTPSPPVENVVAGQRLEKSFFPRKGNHDYELTNESGRSSSNLTVQLDMTDKAGHAAAAGAEAEFYSIHQSNATSPNYPRPKQCYQLQQQRRSLGNIKKPMTNLNEEIAAGTVGSGTGSRDQLFHPMNNGDCDLGGVFADDEMISSSSSSDLASLSISSGLSDSSEPELGSLGSDDDDDFAQILEKYYNYNDPGADSDDSDDSDCSDLTEVSPLSSISSSPLPPLFPDVEESEEVQGSVMMIADMTLLADNQFSDEDDEDDEDDDYLSEEFIGQGLSSRAADIVYDRQVNAKIDCLPSDEYEKPRLPLFISTTESIIVPDKAQENNEKDELVHPSRSIEDLAKNNLNQKMGTAKDDFFDLATSINVKEERSFSPNLEGALALAQPMKEGLNGFGVSFDFSSSSLPTKEGAELEPFSRSSTSTAAWSISSSSGGAGGTGSGNQNNARASSSSTSATSSNGSGALSRGSVGRGRRLPRNYTFTPEQLRKIDRENQILLRKITDTTSRNQQSHSHYHLRNRIGHGHGHGHGHHTRSLISASCLARIRQQKRIEYENNLLMKRLQSVKPSREIEKAFDKPPAPVEKH